MARFADRLNIKKFGVIGMVILLCLFGAIRTFETGRWAQSACLNFVINNVACFYLFGISMIVSFLCCIKAKFAFIGLMIKTNRFAVTFFAKSFILTKRLIDSSMVFVKFFNRFDLFALRTFF